MARNVIPFRRPPRTRPPRRHWADPRVYLKWVIVAAAAGLLILPLLADGATLVAGARGPEGCRVLRVIDGDTVTIWCPRRGAERVRLTGYDAPETRSPGCPSEYARGVAATWALRALLLRGGTLALRDEGRDRYGRRLAAVSVDGRAVAAGMIAGGHGRPYAGGPRAQWCG